jgi:hypothetical protein
VWTQCQSGCSAVLTSFDSIRKPDFWIKENSFQARISSLKPLESHLIATVGSLLEGLKNALPGKTERNLTD